MPEQSEERPSLLQPWLGRNEQPTADTRATGEADMASVNNFSELNQPEPPAETIPVTGEGTPAEPVNINSGPAITAVEPLNLTPIEKQPETTGLSPEQAAKAAQLTEELRIKAEKRRADLNIEAQALDEEVESLEKLRDSLTKPQ